MIKTLEVISKEYGCAEDYVKQICGLSEDDVFKIRSRLLAKGEKGEKVGWSWGHVSRL